jgi:MFS family permease
MTDEGRLRQELLGRIRMRRASIDAFLREQEPRADRQANLSIISSAVAAALTAGPALGGTKFTETAQHALALPQDSLVWQLLCLAAAIVSIVAAVSSTLYKSRDTATRLSKAEAANAQLEGLETVVEFGALPFEEAVKQFQQYVAVIPYVPEHVATEKTSS